VISAGTDYFGIGFKMFSQSTKVLIKATGEWTVRNGWRFAA